MVLSSAGADDATVSIKLRGPLLKILPEGAWDVIAVDCRGVVRSRGSCCSA